jgi:hypothetical protein
MNNELIIETYPNELRLIAIGMFLIAIYGYFIQGTADLFGFFISVFCGSVLYSLLDRKITTFSKDEKSILISSKRIFDESQTYIQISDITNIDVVKGKGSTGGFWFIKVFTSNESYPITSMGSLSKKSLDKTLIKIKQYLQ